MYISIRLTACLISLGIRLTHFYQYSELGYFSCYLSNPHPSNQAISPAKLLSH